jgi:hypothetical protein
VCVGWGASDTESKSKRDPEGLSIQDSFPHIRVVSRFARATGSLLRVSCGYKTSPSDSFSNLQAKRTFLADHDSFILMFIISGTLILIRL